VAVRVTGPGCVVANDCGLQALHRHGHLLTTRPDPGGDMLCKPADDLPGGAVLRALIGGRHIRVEFGRERPRLRPVHHHLDEAHRVRVLPQPPPRLTGLRVEAGHPRLIGIAGKRGELAHLVLGAGGVAAGEAAAFGEVVVIGAVVVGIQVGTRAARCAPVNLHSAVQFLQLLPTISNSVQ
jgi:hypothetical protein